jgi:hypothetical protein
MATAKQRRELLKAYHEVGHAVIARKLGIAVNRMTVFSTDDTNDAHALTESAAFLSRGVDVAKVLRGAG